MEIVLTCDLNTQKGYIKGAIFDWPRQTISAVTRQQGNNNWFVFNSRILESSQRIAMREAQRETSVVPAEAVTIIEEETVEPMGLERLEQAREPLVRRKGR